MGPTHSCIDGSHGGRLILRPLMEDAEGIIRERCIRHRVAASVNTGWHNWAKSHSEKDVAEQRKKLESNGLIYLKEWDRGVINRYGSTYLTPGEDQTIRVMLAQSIPNDQQMETHNDELATQRPAKKRRAKKRSSISTTRTGSYLRHLSPGPEEYTHPAFAIDSSPEPEKISNRLTVPTRHVYEVFCESCKDYSPAIDYQDPSDRDPFSPWKAYEECTKCRAENAVTQEFRGKGISLREIYELKSDRRRLPDRSLRDTLLVAFRQWYVDWEQRMNTKGYSGLEQRRMSYEAYIRNVVGDYWLPTETPEPIRRAEAEALGPRPDPRAKNNTPGTPSTSFNRFSVVNASVQNRPASSKTASKKRRSAALTGKLTGAVSSSMSQNMPAPKSGRSSGRLAGYGAENAGIHVNGYDTETDDNVPLAARTGLLRQQDQTRPSAKRSRADLYSPDALQPGISSSLSPLPESRSPSMDLGHASRQARVSDYSPNSPDTATFAQRQSPRYSPTSSTAFARRQSPQYSYRSPDIAPFARRRSSNLAHTPYGTSPEPQRTAVRASIEDDQTQTDPRGYQPASSTSHHRSMQPPPSKRYRATSSSRNSHNRPIPTTELSTHQEDAARAAREATVASVMGNFPDIKMSWAKMLDFHSAFFSLQRSIGLTHADQMVKNIGGLGNVKDEASLERLTSVLQNLAALNRT